MALIILPYDNILNFWFPDNTFQDFWFTNAKDHDIRINYGNLLQDAEDGKLDNWVEYPESKLALIILLDQFSRNIYRKGNFRKNDEVCIKIAMSVVNSEEVNSYPIHQRIFIYLPLRHQHKTPYLDLVMTHITKWESTDLTANELNIARRFKNATLRDYGKVIDTIEIIDKETPMFSNIGYVLDDECIKYNEIAIGLLSVKTSKSFDQVINSPTCLTIKTFIHRNFGKNATICISLSGGVDSMWISLALKALEIDKEILKVVAVHVDYANRKESNDEANFVINWSKFLGIPICYRRIEHMKRGDEGIDITLYESETKKIRFALYKYVIEKYNVVGVILGHHGDDTDENVLMNILRGNDLLKLNGMKDIQNIDGVNICRPLLIHPKSDIYESSHQFQVPYLKDTTSERCYRGFIRKTLIPSIRVQDPVATSNIKLAGQRSDEWSDVIDRLIFKPMVQSVKDCKHGFTIPYKPDHSGLPKVFWSNYFAVIFHARGYHMCSSNNLNTFINWFNRSGEGMCRMSNGLMCCIYLDELIFIDYALINHVNKDDKVEITIGDSFEINGWKIETIVGNNEDRCNTVSHVDILNGSYHFYLHQIDETSTKFIFTHSKGKDRNLKRHFKGCDNILKYVPKLRANIVENNRKTFRVNVTFMDSM